MKLPFNTHLTIARPFVPFRIGRLGRSFIQIGRHSGLTAGYNCGKGYWITYRLGPDYDEQIVWKIGDICYTRPETEREKEDREDAEAEAAFMAYEANRYTEWSY